MKPVPRSLRRAAAATAALTLSFAAAVAVTAPTMAKAATSTQSVTIDGSSSGRTFDGVGAVSGGGATSRLLVDYPEPQRTQVLDYMFKPDYGAGVQLLKVEIGGDANSTDGPEASHMRTPTDVNCNRGYEWWLMEQAAARNPNIKFYGLEWAAPGWLNGGVWSQDNITYLLAWIGCAQSHGLTVSYLGGWNESGYDKTWYENLRSALDGHGYTSTKLVAADVDDPNWSVASDLASDPAFNAAVAVEGTHGVCWHSSPVYTSCPGSSTAIGLGKPLWVSEDDNDSADGINPGPNPPALARNVNRMYIDAKITADVKWALIDSWPAHLPFYGAGMMTADQPWSGSYTVGRDIWVMAHTAQFAQPGWKYLDSSSGYLTGTAVNKDPHPGSYVTFKSGQDYSTVVETTDAAAATTVNFTVTGGLSPGLVHVWATNLASTDPAQWFLHTQDLTPQQGAYSLTLQPGYIYTLTTTAGQAKGTATSPPSSPLALPYQENLSGQTAGSTAPYLHDWAGAFEVASCPAGTSAPMCVRQVLTNPPIPWRTNMQYTPATFLGDPNWTNYQASADVLFEQSGTSAELLGRIDHVDHDRSAYHLKITDAGSWTLYSENSSSTDTTLASGTYSGGVGTWHNLSLAMQGSSITAFVDHTQVASVPDGSHTGGQMGLAVGGFQNVDFANIAANPVAAPASSTVTSVNSGMCLDVSGASVTAGAQVIQWTCNGQANQQWQKVAVSGTSAYQFVSANSGMCLDVTGASTTAGAQVIQWTCGTGKPNQEWTLTPVSGSSAYQLVSVNSGMCLDVTGASITAGAQVIQWTCGTGKPNQEWTIP